MKKFDILVCTSKFESLPLSVIESISMSIPILSTDVGDIKKIVCSKKNKCGIILNGFNEDKFLKKIYLLTKDKKKLSKYSNNARKVAISKFSIKDYTRKFEKLILV